MDAHDRQELAARLRTLRTSRVRDAFLHVDRADFVPEEMVGDAYGDVPLPIGHGQTISQPTTVAFMLELLDVRPGQRVLDIGAGSGWTTALLGHIVGRHGSVTGVERVPALVAFGTRNLRKYDMPHAHIVQAYEDVLGLPDEDPYERILVSAAAPEFPEHLLRQLRVGGKLIIPIRNSVWLVERKSRTRITRQEHLGFVFVPLHVPEVTV